MAVNMFSARRLFAGLLLLYVTGVWYCCVFGENVVGGRIPLPTNSAVAKQAALFAVTEYNKDHSNQTAAFKIVRIISAENRVVAGTHIFLEMKLGQTQCMKDTTGDALQSCPLQPHGKVLLCRFVVTHAQDVCPARIQDITIMVRCSEGGRIRSPYVV